jgi:2-keto-3-deoxy-L-rhamnonate aldolase RhmA
MSDKIFKTDNKVKAALFERKRAPGTWIQTENAALAQCPPEGVRGFAFCCANDWGVRFDGYLKSANNYIAVVVMIESNLAVDGVEGVFIGSYDLIGSYRITGQTSYHVIKYACKQFLMYARNIKRLQASIPYSDDCRRLNKESA